MNEAEITLDLSQLSARHLQLLIAAYHWGYADGAAGRPLHGSDFFEIAGQAWQTYNDRYLAGLATRQPSTPKEKEEIAFLQQVLDSLRAGHTPPITHLTPEQLEEIERERPGEDFSRSPFFY